MAHFKPILFIEVGGVKNEIVKCDVKCGLLCVEALEVSLHDSSEVDSIRAA